MKAVVDHIVEETYEGLNLKGPEPSTVAATR